MAKSKPQWVKKTFVRFELEPAQLKACKAAKFDLAVADDSLLPLMDRDYSVKLSYDNFNSCYMAIMQTDNKADPNNPLLLVGRGSSPMKALKQLLFKHNACDGVWPTPEFSPGQSEWDD